VGVAPSAAAAVDPPPRPSPASGEGAVATCDAQRWARLRALLARCETVAAELVEARVEVDAVTAQAAFGEDSGNFRGFFARAQPVRIHDHPRQPRRQCQLTQALAFRGDPAIAVERIEFAQQTARLLQCRRGGRIEKRQRRGIADAPLREVEHQRRQIGAENFGAGCRPRATAVCGSSHSR